MRATAIGSAARATSVFLASCIILGLLAQGSFATPAVHTRRAAASAACREILSATPLTRFPILPGCVPIDSFLIGATKPTPTEGSVFVSVPGKNDAIVVSLRTKLRSVDYRVHRTTRAATKCRVETELYAQSFACPGVTFDRAELHGSLVALQCSRRAQVEIFYSTTATTPAGVVPCLAAKETGAAVNRADAQRYLLEQLCRSGSAELSAYPSPVYALDQLDQGWIVGADGYGGFHEVEGARCTSLRIVGVLPVAPGQVDWRLPEEYATRERESRNVPVVWVLTSDGWAWLNANGIFSPTTPMREALEAFRLAPLDKASSGSSGAGQPDLALDAVPHSQPGQACNPGEEPSGDWTVSVTNGGTTTSSAQTELETSPPAAASETRLHQWTRGLEPGESLVLGDFAPGTDVRVDPRSQLPDSNRANNEVQLEPLEPLVCVPT